MKRLRYAEAEAIHRTVVAWAQHRGLRGAGFRRRDGHVYLEASFGLAAFPVEVVDLPRLVKYLDETVWPAVVERERAAREQAGEARGEVDFR